MSERHGAPSSAVEARVAALEALLVERDLITTDAIESVVQTYEHEVGPHVGARVVARAWSDPAFRERLLADGTAAVAELGVGGAQGEVVVVHPNGPGPDGTRVHHLVVCTLCSCYPWPLLGLPPTWYKSAPYRSRAVREPRAVLTELGVDLPDDVDVRVWDSTAEVRHLVLPERPAGAEGLDEEALAALVTRDAMIGTGLVAGPAAPR